MTEMDELKQLRPDERLSVEEIVERMAWKIAYDENEVWDEATDEHDRWRREAAQMLVNPRPSLSPAGVTEEEVEAAARAYLLAIDIDPDLPHGLKPDGKAWWKVEAPRIRDALEAAANARSPADAKGDA